MPMVSNRAKWLASAGAVTAILVGFCLYLYVTVRAEYATRARVTDMVMTGREAAQAVDAYLAKHGQAPLTLEQAGFSLSSRHVDSIVHRNNEIAVSAGFKPIQGKRIVLKKKRNPDGQIGWACLSEDIAPEYLPAHCR